ncbi:hypothetical protein [Spiroplasma endosymbiont of Nebria brevicollis]|uniref:hypothetical protein n=1 Tax=Spiroplasma endosymbiont of Nebria brevicollis TaxID=3066284 RepID=UPI003CC7AE93
MIIIQKLKELLGLNQETYVQSGKFNRGAFERDTINKALKEINLVSNWTCQVKWTIKRTLYNYYYKCYIKSNFIGINLIFVWGWDNRYSIGLIPFNFGCGRWLL